VTEIVQRWRERRDSYRPVGEPIRTADYDVEPIPESLAKMFVKRHHYAGSYPAARFRYGLIRRGELVGASVFSHPCRDEVLTRWFPGDALASTELGRFVLLDNVPANGETWFLGRAFELLRREGLVGVLAFSDPVARTTSIGAVVKPGHIGTIYQAHNGRHLGRSKRRTLLLLPDGTVFSERSETKIRARHRGWRYAAAQLIAHGAAELGEADDSRAWLDLWLPRLTRAIAHPGNFRYCWPLDRTMRKVLPVGQPYPKEQAA
jgi:hypothetical protein